MAMDGTWGDHVTLQVGKTATAMEVFWDASFSSQHASGQTFYVYTVRYGGLSKVVVP